MVFHEMGGMYHHGDLPALKAPKYAELHDQTRRLSDQFVRKSIDV
jgi:hypothetical protein